MARRRRRRGAGRSATTTASSTPWRAPSTPTTTESPTPQDPDSDADGLPDRVEGLADPDADGSAAFRDAESDGDFISDQAEAGPTRVARWIATGTASPTSSTPTATADGIVDRVEANPIPEKAGDADIDDDGVPDDEDPSVVSTRPPADLDQDGMPDYRDNDSDGDGITDRVEGSVASVPRGLPELPRPRQPTTTASPIVSRQAANPAAPVDTDGGGLPDFRDVDADGDLIYDQFEVRAQPRVPGRQRPRRGGGLRRPRQRRRHHSRHGGGRRRPRRRRRPQLSRHRQRRQQRVRQGRRRHRRRPRRSSPDGRPRRRRRHHPRPARG